MAKAQHRRDGKLWGRPLNLVTIGHDTQVGLALRPIRVISLKFQPFAFVAARRKLNRTLRRATR